MHKANASPRLLAEFRSPGPPCGSPHCPAACNGGEMPWDFKTQQGNGALDTKHCSPVSAGLFLTALPSAIGSSAAASDLLNSPPLVSLAARALYVTGKGAAARQEFPRFLTSKLLSPHLCVFLPAAPGERALHVAGATPRGRCFSLIFSETMSVHHLSSQALCMETKQASVPLLFTRKCSLQPMLPNGSKDSPHPWGTPVPTLEPLKTRECRAGATPCPGCSRGDRLPFRGGWGPQPN